MYVKVIPDINKVANVNFKVKGLSSEYVAKYIAEKIEDDVENLFDRIRKADYSSMESERPWVVVVPTYAWRIPKPVEMFLRKTDFIGSQEMYFVMTCGQDNGCAGKYLYKMYLRLDP